MNITKSDSGFFMSNTQNPIKLMSSDTRYDSLMSGSSASINQLYDALLPKLKSWLLKNKGSNNDALDILHDALSSLIVNHHKGKRLEVKNIEAYIFQMCKYIWFGILNKRKSASEVTFDGNEIDTTESGSLETMIQAEQERIKYEVMENSFLKLSELCQKLLELVKQGKKAKQIAETLGMNGQSTVNRRKSACLDSWRKFISEEPKLKYIQNYE